MGRVSKRVIKGELLKELEEQLAFIVGTLTKKEEITIFLNEFLTAEEKVMLGKRLALYMLLKRGYTNTQIYNVLAVSQETIRLYRQLFERKQKIFQKIIDKLLERKMVEDFWKKVDTILEPVYIAMKAKTNMKARARLATGDFWKGYDTD